MKDFFDTLTVHAEGEIDLWHDRAVARGFNFRRIDNQRLGISLDESVTQEELKKIAEIFELKIFPAPMRFLMGAAYQKAYNEQGQY